MPQSRPRPAPSPFSAWHRDHPERRAAGVCAAIADAWSLPVAGVRAAFVVAGFLPGLRAAAILGYLGLWAAIPERSGAAPAAQRASDFLEDWFDDVRESFFDESASR